MVDIHCHIVPGVDDGSESVAMSLEMIRAAEVLGLTAIATTPHYVPGVDTLETIEHHASRLAQVKPQNKFGLKLSREVRVNTALLGYTSFSELTYGGDGKFILLELPSQEVPTYLDTLLFTLRLDGITPIIAHPERNAALLHEPRKVIDLLSAGCHLQLTCSAVSGELGPSIENFSCAMLKAGFVSFLASDAHNLTTRPFSVWPASLEATAAAGADPELLSTINPQAVFDGEPIQPVELTRELETDFLKMATSGKSASIKKRKRFFFF